MLYYEKGWFAERSRVYKELSERDNLFEKLDSTFFYFTSPEAGWIDMEMYLNGKKRLTCDCSEVFDPFIEMRMWLEDIVRSINMENTMRIDCEGREVYLHYEKLRDAEDGVEGRGKSAVFYDVNTRPEIGLFYVYDSDSDTIPFYAICETKDFVNSVYLALLSLCGNCYNTHHSDFASHWYYSENNLRTFHKLNNMTFYNDIKSPLIEWNIRSPRAYGADIRFRKMPKIKETISMWCDYGDALFWGRGTDGKGGCCGNADSLFTETAGEIKLDSIKGLREWYEKWDSASLSDNWTKKQWRDWDARGYSFALQVRKLLPDTIDLFYNNWYPKIKVVREKNEYKERYPMIVFNENSLSRSSSRIRE